MFRGKKISIIVSSQTSRPQIVRHQLQRNLSHYRFSYVSPNGRISVLWYRLWHQLITLDLVRNSTAVWKLLRDSTYDIFSPQAAFFSPLDSSTYPSPSKYATLYILFISVLKEKFRHAWYQGNGNILMHEECLSKRSWKLFFDVPVIAYFPL